MDISEDGRLLREEHDVTSGELEFLQPVVVAPILQSGLLGGAEF